MKKSELLRALQTEIHKYNLSTFMSAEHKIVQTGCSTIAVGDEFVLSADVDSLVEINEVAQRGLIKAIAGPVPKTPPGLIPPPQVKL